MQQGRYKRALIAFLVSLVVICTSAIIFFSLNIILGRSTTSNDISFTILSVIGDMASIVSLVVSMRSLSTSKEQPDNPAPKQVVIDLPPEENTKPQTELPLPIQESEEQPSLGLYQADEYLKEKFLLLKRSYRVSRNLYDLNELIELRANDIRQLEYFSLEWFNSTTDLRMMLKNRYEWKRNGYDRIWLTEVDGQLSQYESRSSLSDKSSKADHPFFQI